MFRRLFFAPQPPHHGAQTTPKTRDTSIVFRNRFIRPRDTVKQIRVMQKTCASESSFLECCVQYADAEEQTKAFAQFLQRPELADVDCFMAEFHHVERS